jgi:hypothetical protein
MKHGINPAKLAEAAAQMLPPGQRKAAEMALQVAHKGPQAALRHAAQQSIQQALSRLPKVAGEGEETGAFADLWRGTRFARGAAHGGGGVVARAGNIVSSTKGRGTATLVKRADGTYVRNTLWKHSSGAVSAEMKVFKARPGKNWAIAGDEAGGVPDRSMDVSVATNYGEVSVPAQYMVSLGAVPSHEEDTPAQARAFWASTPDFTTEQPVLPIEYTGRFKNPSFPVLLAFADAHGNKWFAVKGKNIPVPAFSAKYGPATEVRHGVAGSATDPFVDRARGAAAHRGQQGVLAKAARRLATVAVPPWYREEQLRYLRTLSPEKRQEISAHYKSLAPAAKRAWTASMIRKLAGLRQARATVPVRVALPARVAPVSRQLPAPPPGHSPARTVFAMRPSHGGGHGQPSYAMIRA